MAKTKTTTNTVSTIDPESPRIVTSLKRTWSPAQISTIHRSIASDTNEFEFIEFMEFCKAKKLDPFLKQAVAMVFNKDKPESRKLQIIVTQEGQRSLAAMCGDYRPAEAAPDIHYTADMTAKRAYLVELAQIKDLAERLKQKGELEKSYPTDPLNPYGIEWVQLFLHKQDPKSDKWHPVNGFAYWTEYAPVKVDPSAYTWEDTGETWEDSGKPKKRRVLKPGATASMTLDGVWPRMGIVMITKCANMVGLRAGWPAVFGGTYDEAEVERVRADESNVIELEAVDETDRRLAAIGHRPDDLPFVTNDGNLGFESPGQFGDAIVRLARAAANTAELDAIQDRNRQGLQLFWAVRKSDALLVKKELEAIRAKLPTPQPLAFAYEGG